MQQPSTSSTSPSNQTGQSNTTGQPGQSASSGQTGQSTTTQTANELKSDAQQLGSKAADRLHSEVDARKSAAVSQAQSVSSAIEQTAGQLDENTPQWLKSALQQGAQQIQRFADSIEQKDSRQLMREAQDFARNNPGTFLAACAAAGFAAARIFKAGAEQQSSGQFAHNEYEQGGRFSEDRFGGSQSSFDESKPWGSGEQDQFGQDDLIDDTLGQGQRSAADASSGQPGNQGGRQFYGDSGSDSFIARPETQSPTSREFKNQDEDPLVLGTGGEAGRRLPDEGEIR